MAMLVFAAVKIIVSHSFPIKSVNKLAQSTMPKWIGSIFSASPLDQFLLNVYRALLYNPSIH